MKLVRLDEQPELGVSHNPDIKKKVLISSGEIPNLMMFGSAVFKPGHEVSTHAHATMAEVFFVRKGKITFEVEGKELVLEEGHCITIEAGERHRQYNSFEDPAELLYFGLATE